MLPGAHIGIIGVHRVVSLAEHGTEARDLIAGLHDVLAGLEELPVLGDHGR